MKVIVKQNNIRFIRFDRGEEFLEIIQNYCNKENIHAAYLTAIGACGELHLSWYDVHEKKYVTKVCNQDLEITGLIGNISLIDGKVFCHAHGTFSDHNLKAVAGHLKKMVISATCEIRLEIFDGTIQRGYDEVTGLNLMK